MTGGSARGRPLVSVVIPLLDEEAVLPELHGRLAALASRAGERAGGGFDLEILFVDDGSTDGSLDLLRGIAARDPSVRVLSLTRNFGQEAACAAGIDRAAGDAVVVMDADLQDPPEAIEALVGAWQGGADVVHARRRSRRGEPVLKRALAWAFYRAIRHGSDAPVVADAGGFRLISRKMVDGIGNARDRGRFLRGLAAWVGGRQETVEFDRDPRRAGRTKYGLGRQAGLAIDAITSFSALPVRIVGIAGCALAASGALAAAVVAVLAATGRALPPAHALLGSGIALATGLVMASLGIVGEYLFRLGREARGLPLYVVDREIGFSREGDRAAGPEGPS